MIRLALLPSPSSDWWHTLVLGLVERGDVDVLWVADEPPPDARATWLPLHGGAAPAATGDVEEPGPRDATGAGDAPPSVAALLVDVLSPVASLVVPLVHEVTVLTVVERPGLLVEDVAVDELDWSRAGLLPPPPPPPPPAWGGTHEPGFDRAAAVELAAASRALVCTDGEIAAMVPAALRGHVRLVSAGFLPASGPVAPAPPADGDGAGVGSSPAVAVIGAASAEEVQLAWSRITWTWPDAVLVSNLADLGPAERTRVLRQVHAVVVLDAGGSNLAEALASGATVIAHGDEAASALIRHAVDGLLTDCRAPDLLAATLEYALTYHAQLAPLRQAGTELARRSFGPGGLAARLLDVLDDVQRAGTPLDAPAGAAPAQPVPPPPLRPERGVGSAVG